MGDPQRWLSDSIARRSTGLLAVLSEVRGFDAVPLDEEGGLPADMVRIPGGLTSAWLTGIDPYSNGAVIDEFLIDKYEVPDLEGGSRD